MISGEYQRFYEALLPVIPKERMFHDALSTLAYGTDASFYRLIPKLVIRARNEQEIAAILHQADLQNIPVTFRAAGTSLSGQAITDSLLVVCGKKWERHEVLDGGAAAVQHERVLGRHAVHAVDIAEAAHSAMLPSAMRCGKAAFSRLAAMRTAVREISIPQSPPSCANVSV